MVFQELKPARLAELSELAGYYADLYCPGTQRVDPVVLAEALGLSYSTNDYSGRFDGLLEYKNGKFHVFLHVGEHDHLYAPRVRFSFAHELGHFLIDSHRHSLQRPGVKAHGSLNLVFSDQMIEREADYFAACLLMPEHRFKNDLFRRKFGFNLVDELRMKYQVSMTATLMRFIALGNHPIMVVCSQQNKYKWLRYSGDFPFKRLNLGAGLDLPDCTAAAEFFADGTKYSKPQKVFAEDWFVLYSDRDRRRPFNEFCVYYEPLGQVVSLVWE